MNRRNFIGLLFGTACLPLLPAVAGLRDGDEIEFPIEWYWPQSPDPDEPIFEFTARVDGFEMHENDGRYRAEVVLKDVTWKSIPEVVSIEGPSVE